MSIGTIILIILIIALLGGFSGIGGGPFYGTGYYGGGGLGLVIVILLILFCSGSCKFHFIAGRECKLARARHSQSTCSAKWFGCTLRFSPMTTARSSPPASSSRA